MIPNFKEWLNERRLDYTKDSKKITDLLLDFQSFLEKEKYKVTKISHWNSKYLDGNFVNDMITIVNQGNSPFRDVTFSNGKETLEFTISMTKLAIIFDFRKVPDNLSSKLDDFFTKNSFKKQENSLTYYKIR